MSRILATLFSFCTFTNCAFAQIENQLPIGASNCAIAQVLNLPSPTECVDLPLGQTRGIVIQLNGKLASPTKDILVQPASAPKSTVTANADHAAAKSENGYYIHFAFNSFDLEPDYKEHLNRLSSVLTSETMISSCLRITGHTDSVGSNEYNLELSEKRAVMVATYLADLGGLDPVRIQISAAGETAPLPDFNSTDSHNRRVEFLTKESIDGCE